MTFDEQIAAMKAHHFESIRASRRVWIVEERGTEFIIHEWMPGGVAPQHSYPTLRKAAARLLQVMHVGAVAPQTWPERVEIGSVATDQTPEIGA